MAKGKLRYAEMSCAYNLELSIGRSFIFLNIYACLSYDAIKHIRCICFESIVHVIKIFVRQWLIRKCVKKKLIGFTIQYFDDLEEKKFICMFFSMRKFCMKNKSAAHFNQSIFLITLPINAYSYSSQSENINKHEVKYLFQSRNQLIHRQQSSHLFGEVD